MTKTKHDTKTSVPSDNLMSLASNGTIMLLRFGEQGGNPRWTCGWCVAEWKANCTKEGRMEGGRLHAGRERKAMVYWSLVLLTLTFRNFAGKICHSGRIYGIEIAECYKSVLFFPKKASLPAYHWKEGMRERVTGHWRIYCKCLCCRNWSLKWYTSHLFTYPISSEKAWKMCVNVNRLSFPLFNIPEEPGWASLVVQW